METSLVEIIKIAFVIGAPIGTLAFHLYKQAEKELERLELRLDTKRAKLYDLEKAILEIKTEFKYIARDLNDIKDLVEKHNKS